MDLNFDFTEKRVIITAFFCMAFTIANLITVKIINIGFLGMETLFTVREQHVEQLYWVLLLTYCLCS